MVRVAFCDKAGGGRDEVTFESKVRRGEIWTSSSVAIGYCILVTGMFFGICDDV